MLQDSDNERIRAQAKARIAEEEREYGCLQDCGLEMDLRDWPTLLRDALRGISGEVVELATRDSEADEAAVLATFLCRVGVEFGSSPHMMVGDSVHYARVNAIVTGASSKARKGTSGKPVSKFFRFNSKEAAQIDPDCVLYTSADETPGPLSTGEGLIYAVRDELRKWNVDKKTGGGTWVVEDPGVEDKRLFVLDEEFASALKCTKREGNTLSATIRSAFDDGNFRQLIKNNATKATGAHIGIVSHITLAELHRLLDETEALNGFANRFLWICSRRQKLVPLPQPMPVREVAAIQKKLLRIIVAAHSVGQIQMNLDAKTLWCEKYEILSSEHPGLIGCVINRAEAMVLRLAMIYCLLDTKDIITPNHIKSALAMWSYAKQSAEYIFSGREANPVSQKILDALEKGAMSMTDIHRLLSNHGSKQQIQVAIQELMAARKIEVIEEKTSGRSKRIIQLPKKAKEAK